MKELLLISIGLMLLSCDKEELYYCNVRIGVINNYTKEYIPVSIDNYTKEYMPDGLDNYNMLYDLYLQLDNGCNDATIDYGNHTIIYTAP